MTRRAPSARARPWRSTGEPPKRILVIRMHAFGDVAITFPYCAALKVSLPETQIDFLTTEPMVTMVEAVGLFSEVITYPPTASRTERIRETVRFRKQFREGSYDLVLDLQNNWISRWIRAAAAPPAWSEFDRRSLLPAGTRTIRAFHAAGFDLLNPSYTLHLRHEYSAPSQAMLLDNGWDSDSRLIVLNPGGLWKSRQWPDSAFQTLALLILHHPGNRILLLGTERIRERVDAIREGIPDARIIDLVGKTSAGHALAVLGYASGMVSEDSGLMHMAWVSGVPTVALLGSSRHVWSAPMGPHSSSFHSGDLHCGSCMKPDCAFGDTHCLARVAPDTVYRELLRLSPGIAEEER